MPYIDIVPFARIPLTQNQKFTYLAPTENKIKIGQIVETPLHNRNVKGVVVKVSKKLKSNIKAKHINKVVCPEILITRKQIVLARWLSHYYYAPLGIVFKTMAPNIPKRIKGFNPLSPSLNKTKAERVLIIASQQKREEYYFQKIKYYLKQDKQILYLEPELSLLPGIRDILEENFPQANIVELHGRLSQGEYFKNWISILGGQAQIILGTRQAILAPLVRLGLIIIDNEHNSSYKQWDMNPYYDARRTSEQLSQIHNASLIFGSNAPQISTFYNAKTKNWKLITQEDLPSMFISDIPWDKQDKTYNKNNKPKSNARIRLVDMRSEIRSGNFSIFSYSLTNTLEVILKQKKQAIIFVNRRGLGLFVMCRDCGHIIKCPNCSTALIEYKNGILSCLHCSFKQNMPPTCPQCSSVRIKSFGTGTQKVLAEVKKLFPQAKIAILDQDHIKRKNDISNIYQKFDTNQIDILIGTQLVLNWGSFNLALVAALNIDSLLNFPSWQTREKTYSLLSNINNSVPLIIQTYNPENKIFQFLLTNNYNAFYQDEIKQRKILDYPPFSQFIKLNFAHSNYNLGQAKFNNLFSRLQTKIQEKKLPVKLIAHSSPTKLERQKYIYTIILKLPNKRRFSKNQLLDLVPPGWTIDVDPDTL